MNTPFLFEQKTMLALSFPGGPELFIILIIAGIPFIMMLGALIDILRSDFEDSQNKLVWLVLVILLPFVGALLYVLIGRGQKAKAH